MAGHLRRLRFHAQPALHEQSRWHVPRRGVLRGVALSEDGEEQAGMGVGVGDYDSTDTSTSSRRTSPTMPTASITTMAREIRRRDVRRARRRDALRVLGRRNRRPGQRRPSRPVYGDRQRLPRGGTQATAVREQDAARRLPQSRQRNLRGADGGGRARGCGRRTAAGDAPSATSTTMATWTCSSST